MITATAAATAAAILAPAVGIAVLGRLTYATTAPACRFWGPVLSRGPAGSRRVAITFDDGPTPGTTDVILEALRHAGVTASFFVIGTNVRKHPDLLRRVYAQGHLIANHSLSHSPLSPPRVNHDFPGRVVAERDGAVALEIDCTPSAGNSPLLPVGALVEAGARVFHFDAGDGHFIPEITIGPVVLASIAPLVHGLGGVLDLRVGWGGAGRGGRCACGAGAGGGGGVTPGPAGCWWAGGPRAAGGGTGGPPPGGGRPAVFGWGRGVRLGGSPHRVPAPCPAVVPRHGLVRRVPIDKAE